MAQEQLLELENAVQDAVKDLKNVSSKKMFGCPAFWVNGNVFALVWKHGRIGVKLPIAEKFEKLMSIKGAAPWKAGPMTMSHWVLVPEKFHSGRQLSDWVEIAYQQNLNAKATKKTVKKKAKT